MIQKLGAAFVKYKALYDAAILRLLPEKLSEQISVTDFGAKGDGVTDDTPAFRAAIKAAYRAGGMGAGVYVPPKDTPYIVTDLIITSAIRLYSDGKYGATLKTHNGSTLIPRAAFTVIEGLNFVGGGKDSNNTMAIRIEGPLITVRDNSFAFYDACVFCEKGKSSAELTIQNNRFAASNYAVFSGGGQINSHFFNNTYSDCYTAIHASEDVSAGVSSVTEGLMFTNELVYSCGNSAKNRKAIEIIGTRWTWFNSCMSDLAGGQALYLEDAKDVKIDFGYYSSNHSGSEACIEVVGACDNLRINGTCISDSRYFGLYVTKRGANAPKNMRLTNVTFQFNDIDSAQQGDLLIDSVEGITATDCDFLGTRTNNVMLISNMGNSSLHLRGCSHVVGVTLTTPQCKLTSVDSPTHPDLQEGVAIIPDGLTFVDVGLRTKALAAATIVAIASIDGTAAEPVSTKINPEGTLRISRVGTSGNRAVAYRVKLVY
ncbi:hypothetical protein P4331_8 [Escherichia phage vB_EcolP_P433.1]|uniref:Rhamnogalacturonase A/B/Epimerase-like pectate lyase domain-containing protein n=1 Tax=Escherichia phage vB_EcolP_P433.1 TaxID=2653657 RepID=A0AAE6NYE3_9CAUD|nr:hypothetical protein P4331_8 [Escherichia phage vB_EcolP_P433.1]